MKKQKPRSKLNKEFDPKVLDKLANEEGSCVSVHRLKHHLALHPYHLNDLSSSIKEILNVGITKYSVELDGILFGYNNIKLLSDLGQIVDDSCFIHVDIEADFYIFKPEVGNSLQGVVNKKSEGHVGCLVHEIFNVSLPQPKHEEDWIGQSVSLGSVLLITVISTNFEGKLPYIKGKIESVLSEPALPIEIPTKKEKQASKKLKKSKRVHEEIEENEELEPPTKKKKKNKSSKVKQEDEDVDLNLQELYAE